MVGAQQDAHYIAVVKRNQPLLHARLAALPWSRLATGGTTRGSAHGRDEIRSLKAVTFDGLDFPHAWQAVKITRWRRAKATGRASRETVDAVSSLDAPPRPSRVLHACPPRRLDDRARLRAPLGHRPATTVRVRPNAGRAKRDRTGDGPRGGSPSPATGQCSQRENSRS
ncbi:hypothetical protein GCM10022220_27030 [Actinocatenispora rupis]|uniref:Uncharacterized protein n=1 Tax=Actinocatenispora rupis TaxID=519421 RepID=A0A8J3J3F4_9ACTN|nr:hypothetical protein Aru02nite_22690 [Actinocatenispora rupis]